MCTPPKILNNWFECAADPAPLLYDVCFCSIITPILIRPGDGFTISINLSFHVHSGQTLNTKLNDKLIIKVKLASRDYVTFTRIE